MGATFAGRGGATLLPLAITGRAPLTRSPTTRRSPAPRSSRRSCSRASRPTARRGSPRRVATRDHTERMLRARGVAVDEGAAPDGRHTVRVAGPSAVAAVDETVPSDPSAAAFWLVAGVDPSRRRAAPRRGEHEPDAACHHRHPEAHGRRHRGARSPRNGRGGRRAARRPRRAIERAPRRRPVARRGRRGHRRDPDPRAGGAGGHRDDADPRRRRAPAQGIRPDRRDRGRASRRSARTCAWRATTSRSTVAGRCRARSPRHTTITGSR